MSMALALAFVATASAETHTWQGPFIGDWSEPGNWSTGMIPDASGDTVVFNNTEGPGADIQVAPPFSPATIGHITVSNTSGANSVVIGATANATDFLTLATPTGQPTLSITGGTLHIHTPLAGTQGFIKTGSGTLSFRDNPHAQSFSGVIGLDGGTLEIGADRDLGDSANDLLVGASSTLLANPPAPANPVVLGPGRGIDAPTGSPILTLGNASDSGVLELAGPLSGGGPLRFNGIGALVLSGPSTRTGSLSYQLRPLSTLTSVTRISELRLVGAGAVPASGQSFVFDLGGGTAQDTAIHARVDLGGFSRALRLSTTGRSNIQASSSVLEITNGELVSDGNGAELRLDAGGPGSTAELRLPASATLTRHSLRIGTTGPGSTTAANSARVRIGTNARFDLFSLRVGDGTASGRLDALAPGATLRLRDGNGTAAMSSLTIGNFSNNSAARVDAAVDLSGVTLDAAIGTLSVGNGAPPHPATAVLSFGAGTLQTDNLTLGAGNSSVAADFDYRVEQHGGDATIGTLRFADGNASGNVVSRYLLRGGNLSLAQLHAGGNFTGSLRPRLEWSGGTLRSPHASTTSFQGPDNLSRPFQIVLSGPARKTLHVDASFFIPPSVQLVGAGSNVVLAKTGSGTLTLSAQTEGFAGTLRLEAGRLSLSSTPSTATLHAGGFVWDAGTLGFSLNDSSTPSNLIAITGALTKTAAPASSRVFQINSASGYGIHTLATYASTDLTLDDFTVTGVPANTAAEFSVGPSALTVNLHFPSGFTKWRGIYFPSASNLGPAQDLADPDGDGRPNLLEYALGSQPLSADTAAPLSLAITPATVEQPARLALTFQRVADPALTYTVVAADDPSGPWSGEDSEIVFTSTGEANTAGPVTATDPAPHATHPRRFLRLVVTR